MKCVQTLGFVIPFIIRPGISITCMINKMITISHIASEVNMVSSHFSVSDNIYIYIITLDQRKRRVDNVYKKVLIVGFGYDVSSMIS